MYVGHSLLAFTLGALVASMVGVRRERAVLVGLLAGAFAVVPDVDSAYTVFAHLRSDAPAVFPTTEHVWTAEGWLVHRELTHSIVTGTAASVAVFLFAVAHSRYRTSGSTGRTALAGAGSLGVIGALGAIGLVSDALVGLAMIGLYLGAALGLAFVGERRGIDPGWIGGAAAIGLLTHPFGDVFMGRPPAFLYPLWADPPIAKIAVAADPTVNLLALFALEVGLAWAAVVVAVRLRTGRVAPSIEPRAVLGIAFAPIGLLMRPPTLEFAYHFTVGVIGMGVLVGVVPNLRAGSVEPTRYHDAVVTGLAAVTLGILGYLGAYLYGP